MSAFSTWEKELHKMVFDPRYLLLTSEQRKQVPSHNKQTISECGDDDDDDDVDTCVQVFDQFVKSRLKDEYKEKKSKLQKAREEFRQLLKKAKITNRYHSFIVQLLNLT